MPELYAIQKNGKFLSGLFPYEFKAKTADAKEAYRYNIKAIAQDVANQLNAQIYKVMKETVKNG